MTINDRIAALEAKLAALKAEVNKPSHALTGQPGWPMLEAPERGSVYWTENISGEIISWTFVGHLIDLYRFARGRCHKTREGAETASLQEHTTQRLREVIAEVTAEVAPGWVPDWKDDEQWKGYLFFDTVTEGWRIARGAVAFRVPGVLYFPPEAGEEIIRRMGAELDNLL